MDFCMDNPQRILGFFFYLASSFFLAPFCCSPPLTSPDYVCCSVGPAPSGVLYGAVGEGFSIRHMLHVQEGKDGINTHNLLPDTSSGQMNSGLL
jgi:hypothetical protein